MTIAQNIFTIFFAIYFAITIASTNGLDLFDTSEMMDISKYPKSWLRFFLALIFANLIPLGYFWMIIIKLGSLADTTAYTNFLMLVNIFLQSIVGFGFYRILFGLLLIKYDGKYVFYDGEDNSVAICTVLDKRANIQKNPLTHIIPGLIWVEITYLCSSFLITTH